MALPLPQYQSLGQMIQNQINEGLNMQAKQAEIKNALIKNKYAEPQAQADLEKAKLANQLYVPTTQATNAYKIAETNKLNFNQANPLLGLPGTAGQLGAAEYIRSNPNAVADPNAVDTINKSIQRQQNSGLGTGPNEELFFEDLVAKDNPQLKTQQQIYQASNAIRNNKFELPDGTKINPLSPASEESLNRLVKGTTTAAVATSMISSNQADSELNVLGKYALKGLKEFPNTYFNYNPEQLIASFKNDAESQKKLGRYIAARQLQYDIAQNEIKLAMGQPGITSTQELMSMGQQNINSMYPKLGYAAREEAQRYQFEALKEGLKARKKAGIGLYNAMQNPEDEKQTTSEEKPTTAKQAIKQGAEEFKSQPIQMTGPDGKVYNVPQGKAQRFIENGFKRIG